MNKRFAVLTCGGICPGLNDVIRGMVQRSRMYGIEKMYGVPYGFKGLYGDDTRHLELTLENTHDIHYKGGSILGTSRAKMVSAPVIDNLQRNAYDALFVIGGNGGNKAAALLYNDVRDRGVPIQIIGLPKSIDNDIDLIDKCFGFETAVEESRNVLIGAKYEAMSVQKGVSIVNLMGRDSGFIATYASLASGVVDVCLIPELERDHNIDKQRVIEYIRHIIERKNHCVVCIAEGFTSFNINTLRNDIEGGIRDTYVKLFNPSYMIRAGITTANDSIFCTKLGYSAIDAAIAGHSGITVATKKNDIHYYNINDVTREVRKVSLDSFEWRALHQPNFAKCS